MAVRLRRYFGGMTVNIEFTPQLRAIRHYLHEHPERGFQERQTTAYLRRLLGEYERVEFLEDSMETGLAAQIRGAAPGADGGPCIALRADIDALPVTERTGLPFASANPGTMHACGHDIHMASLLGAAFWLAEHPQAFCGNVRLLFQPAEETGLGAKAVMKAGLLDGVDAIVGTHNNPLYKVGQIAVGTEPMMAGCVKFSVALHAEGTHAGYPERGTGPIEAMAAMVQSLQTIVSRNVSAFSPLVVSVTEVHGGDVWNVVPAEAGFQGTVRYFTPADGRLAHERFARIVSSTASAYGIDADIEWDDIQVPLASDARLAAIAARRVPEYASLRPIIPSMAGEDFAEYGKRTRLLFAFIGSNGAPGCAGWHSPEFNALDEAVATGASFYANAALDLAVPGALAE